MNRFHSIFAYVALVPRLGVGNVWAVMRYRRRLARGVFEVQLPVQAITQAKPLWYGASEAKPIEVNSALHSAICARADAICAGKFQRFGEAEINEGDSPQWFKGIYAASSAKHFSRVAINAVTGEDAKLTWDLSRMHWAPRLALAACVTNSEDRARYLARLNHLTTDWLNHNGYQQGLNWACAHEVSIRGLQLMLAGHLLESHLGMRPSAELIKLMQQSWRRVHTVRGYARAQQNNHSLTEHVFLIYAAAFLARHDVPVCSLARIRALHRKLLPLCVALIAKDGSSCMYSTNYHRVFCDILSIAKIFDDAWKVGFFNHPILLKRARAAGTFLAALIEPVSNSMPFIGHNDGSLHCLQYCMFHDAAPSLMVHHAVFGLPLPHRLELKYDDVWLFGYAATFSGVDTDNVPRVQQFDDFGLLIASHTAYRAYVKYPRNQFRPSQLDFLHLDLWVRGQNILPDSGTYSYNPPDDFSKDMSAADAHNAPTFLGCALVPKLSPFLYAFWPKALVKRVGDAWLLGVRIRCKGSISRRVEFAANHIRVMDMVIGSTQAWVSGWNAIDSVTLEGQGVALAPNVSMTFENAQTAEIAPSQRASNYQSLTSTERITLRPIDSSASISTTINIEL